MIRIIEKEAPNFNMQERACSQGDFINDINCAKKWSGIFYTKSKSLKIDITNSGMLVRNGTLIFSSPTNGMEVMIDLKKASIFNLGGKAPDEYELLFSDGKLYLNLWRPI